MWLRRSCHLLQTFARHGEYIRSLLVMGPELLETDSCSQGFISATATLHLARKSLGVWCAIEVHCCWRGGFWWEVLTADYPSMPHLGGGIRLSDVDWGVLVLVVSHMRGGHRPQLDPVCALI